MQSLQLQFAVVVGSHLDGILPIFMIFKTVLVCRGYIDAYPLLSYQCHICCMPVRQWQVSLRIACKESVPALSIELLIRHPAGSSDHSPIRSNNVRVACVDAASSARSKCSTKPSDLPGSVAARSGSVVRQCGSTVYIR